MCLIASSFGLSRLRISSAQSIALWMGRAQEYGLNSMSSWYGLLIPATSSDGADLSGKAGRKPRSPSNIVSAPVNPNCAMAADVTPLRAAGPGLKRFCIEGPYISISPDACAPARPNAEVSFAGVRRDNMEAATVAPKTPHVGVV